MYVVIFRATINHFDAEYSITADKMRELAMSEYGCRDFKSWEEAGEEIAISWWDSKEQIAAWKNNAAHKQAQKKGREHWYKSVSVQVLEVIREY